MTNYIQRLPLEIIINSNDGQIFNNLDGHKTFSLTGEINAKSNEILLIYLKKAFIPFSFYCLSSSQKNNILDIKETQQNGTANVYSITIPDGNYNINELNSEIVNLLESNSTFGFKYSVSFIKTTAKVRFLLLSGTNALKAELLFNSGANSIKSCRRLLGYTATDIEFTLSATAISQNIVDMADGLDSIRIGSSLTGDNIKTTNGETGELLIVPVDYSPFSILYFDAISPFKHKLATRNIKEIEIKMTDLNDNIIDFNGIPYTLILEVEFMHNPLGNITNRNVKLDTKESADIRKNIFNDIMNKMNEEKEEKK
tara:strand:+ start:4276 stop:5214 length:939 start_codon:yes stop_codon:yes gene_type:complete